MNEDGVVFKDIHHDNWVLSVFFFKKISDLRRVYSCGILKFFFQLEHLKHWQWVKHTLKTLKRNDQAFVDFKICLILLIVVIFFFFFL